MCGMLVLVPRSDSPSPSYAMAAGVPAKSKIEEKEEPSTF